MGSIIDLHIHTIVGSLDSGISVKRLVEGTKAAGLTGVVLAEHQTQWRPEEVERLREESGLFVFAAREWDVDMGHIITLGLDRGVQRITKARELRQVCQDNGAYMVMCHPFRYFPGPSNFLFGNRREAEGLPVEELAEHPFFSLVDAVEVLNAGCTDRENRVAQEVARCLGLPGTAGSDAHWPMEVGRRYATVFEKELVSEEEMLEELQAGRFYPAQRVDGVFVLLEEAVKP